MSLKDSYSVLLFSEAFGLGPEELGGKGYGLALMAQLGMPVPPGVIIPVKTCKELAGSTFSFRHDFRIDLNNALRKLEKTAKKKLGDPQNPLFVSARSGAPVSMPGMMDTTLNLGLSQETLPAFAKLTDRKFAEGVYRRLVVNLPATDLEDQIFTATQGVIQSWDTPRAKEYRQVHAIPDEMGTATIIQMMVFGNNGKRSGTGIIFSRNVKTGEPKLFGEYLPNAQGEKLVSGSQTPKPLDFLKKREPKIYQQLGEFVRKLEKHFQNAVEVEFTIENGKLWLLQVRSAKCAPSATARIMVDLVKERVLKEWEVLEKIDPLTLAALKHPKTEVDHKIWKKAVRVGFLVRGIPAAGGFATGKAVFTSEKAVESSQNGESVILFRPETNAEDVSGILAASAIVTSKGGQTCHAAVVARSLGRPAVVGAEDLNLTITGDTYRGKNGREIKEGDLISVNGYSGIVVLGKIDFRENGKDEYAQKILKWEESHPQRPRINFRLVKNNFSVNRILADFYVTERLARDLANTSLAQEAEDLRCRTQNSAAQIFSLYLLLAIAGESRHTSERTKAAVIKPFLLAKLHSFGVANHETGRSDTQANVIKKLEEAKTGQVINFAKLCHKAFRELNWDSHIGGKLWARIAEALEFYLTGRWGVTAFVDRVFNLQHNGGLAFDKHPMVYSYTRDSLLSKQLNAKRDARTLRDLYTGVTLAKERDERIKLSPEVEDLYGKAIEIKGGNNDR